MRRTIAVLAAFGLLLVVGAPQALAANGPKRTTTRTSSFSRSTTSMATSQPNTPGSIQVGCCNAVKNTLGVQTGWTQKTVPAGGIEYLATHMKMLRERNSTRSRSAPGISSARARWCRRCSTTSPRSRR